MRKQARKIWRLSLHVAMSVEPLRRRVQYLASAGRVPKKLWNRLPIIDDVFEVTLPAGQRFRYRTAAGDAIGQALYWRGLDGWEAATIYPFLSLAVRSRRFVDVGANTGAYTLLACAVSDRLRAVAYEPVPRVFERLRDNIERNGLADRCRIEPMAVADACGRTELHVPDRPMPSSASLHRRGFRNIRGRLVDVPLTTLDGDLLANGDDADRENHGHERIDLMKIDVEGFEDKVIVGMKRILNEHRPVIICECNPDGPHAEVERLLAGAGYRFFHLGAHGPERVSFIVPDPHERYRNFACVHREHTQALDLLTRLGQ